MRRFSRLLSVVLTPLALAACVELEQTLKIHADGSGRLEIRVQVKRAAIEQIKARMKGLGLEGDESASKDPFDVARIRKRFAELENLKLQKIERLDDDEKQGMAATIEFASVEALVGGMQALVEGEDTKLGNQMQIWFLKTPDEKNARLVVYPSGRMEYERAQQQLEAFAKMSDEQRAMQEQMFGMMKAGIEGLKITYRFQLPGKVAGVEGVKRVSDDQVVYVIEGKNIESMADMAKVGGVRFVVDFDRSGFKPQLLDREPTDAELRAKAKAAAAKRESDGEKKSPKK